MSAITLQNPVFVTYAIAASLMVLKAVSMSWLTVVRMMQEKGGYRSPEDLRKTLLNPQPALNQTAPNDRVERIRRIQLNDTENLPYFLISSFMFVLTDPSLWLAQGLLYGYVMSRLLHFVAYLGARNHETRAFFWTLGSLIIIFMSAWVLIAALTY